MLVVNALGDKLRMLLKTGEKGWENCEPRLHFDLHVPDNLNRLERLHSEAASVRFYSEAVVSRLM